MLKLLGAAAAAFTLAFAGSASAASLHDFNVVSGSITEIPGQPGYNNPCYETFCWNITGARLESSQTFILTDTPGLPYQSGYMRIRARNSGSGFDETFYIGFNVDGVDYKTYFTAPTGYPNYDTWVVGISAFDVTGLARWIIGSDGPYGPVLGQVSLDKGIVPEPATWAMMIVGFGLAGTGLRRARQGRALAA